MITKGKWFWEYKWYSICSKHGKDAQPEMCEICNIGNWHNTWLSKISSLVYKISPKIWIWFANLTPLKFEEYNKDYHNGR